MSKLYPADEIFGVDFEDLKINEIVFIVAYLNDTPVGCGAIRPIDQESTELKRFFVEEAYRNKGIAKMILIELEARAREAKYKSIKLETGEEQVEAVSFYKKNGYYPTEKFGEYVDSETSRCYEKRF
ncbi:GNAT family N-acetyltransferase [Paenibacillus alkaliterrae]|uniref:GNAT family N-acetyltransferase n=1 Tax=Paenibacillus alkaliterrae TaxID=320909 RepID=UPI001F313406|nr:GNAT family N-acetyltransferase [Paenibacillus alkaliterrae]MCF2937146.1 GNAT family N-acetyltransferase [Paenibacillus alkaliterrae]